MRKLIRKIKMFFVFMKNVDAQTFMAHRVYAPVDHKKYQDDCLALGLWEMFKFSSMARQMVNLDDDADSLLTQYVIENYVEQDTSNLFIAKKKIEITSKLVQRTKDIYDFFEETGFYKKPIGRASTPL